MSLLAAPPAGTNRQCMVKVFSVVKALGRAVQVVGEWIEGLGWLGEQLLGNLDLHPLVIGVLCICAPRYPKATILALVAISAFGGFATGPRTEGSYGSDHHKDAVLGPAEAVAWVLGA